MAQADEKSQHWQALPQVDILPSGLAVEVYLGGTMIGSASCAACNAAVFQGQSYCLHCGAKVIPPASPPKSTAVWLLAGLGGILILYALVGSSSKTTRTITGPPVAEQNRRAALRARLDPPQKSPLSRRDHLEQARRLLKLLDPAAFEQSDVLISLISEHAAEAKLDPKLASSAQSILKSMAMKGAEALKLKSWDSWETALTAEVVCRQLIEANLKAPATAIWGQKETGHWSGHPGFFYVRYTVDAQNAFGAMLRNSFQCKVECLTEKICEVQKLDTL